ncbi:MAG TPA: ABC transporter permease [Thermoanaerobaculia bacterium]|jgi:putative ABC transport system permease protein|nr:ABC transporter permease [Thermoanaerobaculia bacterium]
MLRGLETVVQDLRLSFRTLAKNPGFTAVTALTLALGIGSNTAIFSVVKAVLLDGLPYPHPERLVRITEHSRQAGDMMVSWPDYLDWQQQNQVFSGLAAYHFDGYNLTGVEEPVRLHGMQATASFFALTGAVPILGRVFAAAEDRPGASPVALLANGLWRNRFGGDPRILGKPLLLNGVSYTVVGVLPPSFWLPQPVDVVVPLTPITDNSDWTDRSNHNGLRAMARLKPGISLARARADVDTIERRLERQYPKSNSGETAMVRTFYDVVVEGARPTLLVLLAAVGFVLLTACANVANLLLARASARQKEMAVRAALGSGRRRLVQQALIESVVLSALGGTLGLVLATAGIRPLLALAPQNTPRLQHTHLDLTVLGFATGISILAGLAFGVVPALQTSRPDLVESLKQAARGASASRSRARLRSAALVTEVALALVLVTGAGLMVRSIVRARQVPPGFEPRRLLTFGIKLPDARYPSPERQLRFWQQALERIAALPGVEGAATVRCLPMAGDCWDSSYILGDRPVPPPAEMLDLDSNMVSTDFFRTLRIPVVAGRVFTDRDDAKSLPVAIVNQTLARRLWPHGSALGQRIKQGYPQDPSPWREIVGVVGDVKREGLDAVQGPELFMPFAQHLLWHGSASLVVRTAAADPMTSARLVAREIHAIDKDQPLTDVQPMTRYIGDSLARRQFATLLLAVFGALALLLAAVGTYGVMAYTVSLRMREMGIRMALGAQRADLFRLVVGQGLALAAVGVGCGLLGSLAVTRFLAGLLFGVSATDPATFVAVALLLVAVAGLASFLPAQRATAGDPTLALHHD